MLLPNRVKLASEGTSKTFVQPLIKEPIRQIEGDRRGKPANKSMKRTGRRS